MSLQELIESITILSTEMGQNSQSRKMDAIFDLYECCRSSLEMKFIIRCLHPSGLRIGLSSKSMEKSLLEYLSSLENDHDAIVQDFEQNIFGYRISTPTSNDSALLNVPLKPMVGRPVKNAAEALKTLTKKSETHADLIAEIKYDGERTQIHYQNGKINLFSRNFDSQNKRFWLLKQRLEQHFETNSHLFQIN